MLNAQVMGSISPVTASLYAEDAIAVNQASEVGASIVHTILQAATQSMSGLLEGLNTTGPIGHHINALA
jgi:hypothetical protein